VLATASGDLRCDRQRPRTVGALAAASFVTSDSSGPEALLTSWQPTIM
jgi:hypothetical protein